MELNLLEHLLQPLHLRSRFGNEILGVDEFSLVLGVVVDLFYHVTVLLSDITGLVIAVLVCSFQNLLLALERLFAKLILQLFRRNFENLKTNLILRKSQNLIVSLVKVCNFLPDLF